MSIEHEDQESIAKSLKQAYNNLDSKNNNLVGEAEVINPEVSHYKKPGQGKRKLWFQEDVELGAKRIKVTKKVNANIGLLGQVGLPRCLTIPVLTMSSSPEMTDLLNIQMVVLTMLTEDTEIATIVSSHINLGVEVRAFNVQSRVWDLLDLEDNLEIPDGASIQVNVTDNEPRVKSESEGIETEAQLEAPDLIQVNITNNEPGKVLHTMIKSEPEEGIESDFLGQSADLNEEIRKVKENLEKSRKELQVKEAGKYTYREMIERMQRMECPACPTCNRAFIKKDEATELISELEELISLIPGKVKNLETKVKNLQGKLETLQKIRPEALEMTSKETQDQPEIPHSANIMVIGSQIDQNEEINDLGEQVLQDEDRSPKKKYECLKCDYSSNNSYHLKNHVRHIHEETNDDPEHVDSPFHPSTDDGEIHENEAFESEAEEEGVQIDHHEEFSDKNAETLKHVRIKHTDERPHKCPDCDYKTAQLGHLKIHMKHKHLDEKPHECPDCDYKTVQLSNLKTHMRYRHTKEKPFKCPDCDLITRQHSWERLRDTLSTDTPRKSLSSAQTVITRQLSRLK